MRIISITAITLFGCLFPWQLTKAEPDHSDWSQFRGPNAAGVAEAGSKVPLSFGANENLLWKVELASGASSPCVRGERIFTTGFDKAKQQLLIYCIDRKDGSILWQRVAPAAEIENTHSASNPASGTPAADDERVYVYFGSFGLLCYSQEGELLWSIEQPIPQTRNGSGTSPVVAGELVLLNREERRESYLLAVDRKSGKTVWKHEHKFVPGMYFEGYATPVIWNNQAILHTHAGIRAIDLHSGELVWQVDVPSTGCSTPVIGRDTLYVATWNNLGEPSLRPKYPTYEELLKHDADEDGTVGFDEFPRDVLLFHRPESSDAGGALPMHWVLGMFDQDRDRRVTKDEWQGGLQRLAGDIKEHGLLAIKLGGTGNVTKTHTEVLERTAIPEVPSPLYHDGRIYIVKRGGIVSCFQEEGSKRLFRKRLPAAKSYYASPIVVGQHIFFASVDGKISVVRAGDTLELVKVNDLGERTLATPAVSDNKIYFRTDECLYAFGSSPRAGD